MEFYEESLRTEGQIFELKGTKKKSILIKSSLLIVINWFRLLFSEPFDMPPH